MEPKEYQIIIVGSGPAGLTAAIYAQRARISTLVIEKDFVSGGQMVKTYEVDNYPGLPGISGYDMGESFREHAEKLGAVFIRENVKKIELQGCWKKVVTNKGEYLAKTVILAVGARHRMLGIPGEEELQGMGVSYCATCDGAFFKDKVAVVAGGGDVAVEDAIFLSRICRQVYLIHRRGELRAAKGLQEKIRNLENVKILWDTVLEEIKGKDQVESLRLKNVKTGESFSINADGVFIAVGMIPNTDNFKELLKLSEDGYIQAGEDCVTSVPGIYAAGDIRTKKLRQIVTAAADGANAVESAQKYLLGQE
ncbi:MAG: thioredoxin-disulfide reductase [Blautia sp.]